MTCEPRPCDELDEDHRGDCGRLVIVDETGLIRDADTLELHTCDHN